MPGYRKSVPVDYISGRTRASKEQPASREQQPEPHPEPQPEQPPEPQPEPQLEQQPEPQLVQQAEPQLKQHPAPHPEQQPEQQIVDLVEDFLPPPPPELISSKMSSGGINLKKYNGSESPLIWLSTLQSWQDFHNLSDARTMAAMSFNMEGAAALWLQGLSGEDKTDFIKFKELFITRF
ncbi:protein TonB-like [Ylistrum balloti]|uniref:protein TonB-like n=1 Tax=Ylistrum balloti TaxID=509963 RepID=UPI0029058EA7|nr:protein TonB-like [Ylistrum balloti]